MTGNSPDEESSSTVSPNKDSSTEKDHAVRKKRRLPFSPGKRKKWTVSPWKKRSTPLHLEKESGLTVSPETEKSSIEVLRTTNTQAH